MPLNKVLFTLNVDDYCKEITDLTYPLLRRYAEKIGADFYIINKRKFLGYPPVYEKFQIYELGKNNDWNIYIDSDALVHPDMFDPTNHIQKDTVMHNGSDMAGNRWRYDNYFRRDGRHIGSCNWFTIGSDWCIDLWHPLEDITYEEALENIFPIQYELNTVITKEHLVDDYVVSRNIAKYGLKFTTCMRLLETLGMSGPGFMWHQYTISRDEKVTVMKQVLDRWNNEGKPQEKDKNSKEEVQLV